MKENIIRFFQKQTCASISCVDEGGKPWSFTVFYAFDPALGLLYYKSSTVTRHSETIIKNAFVAGTVLPDKLNKLVVQGIQFEGLVLDPKHPAALNASQFYHKKHPLALTHAGDMWTIEISYIKMTDSTLGFGKKIEWRRNNDPVPSP